MIHKATAFKPDGRRLMVYDSEPIPPGLVAPQPPGDVVAGSPELRWHPLRAEWVGYAGHRQNRTFLPPDGSDPLAPTHPGAPPTELPPPPWRVAVFENRFPALTLDATTSPANIVETRPGTGVCEVVVYTPDQDGSIGTLPLEHLVLLIGVWADRTLELGALDSIQYVMPFENRGAEVGATLHHPHGQVYAYPFVPPLPGRALFEQSRYRDAHGSGLLERVIQDECGDGRRILFEGSDVVAFVPAFARLPFEVWVAPRRPVPSLPALTKAQRYDFARALQCVVCAFDAMHGRPFPYVMVIHQAPTDGAEHPEAHVHAEFYPPYRSRDRLKYLAGTEIGAGTFSNDVFPEHAAELLRSYVRPGGRSVHEHV